MRSWDSFALVRDVSAWTLHPHTVLALGLSSVQAQPEHGDLHVYTDGSSCDGTAGWAVVLVANEVMSGSSSFSGCFGGKVAESDDLGTSSTDALQAEQALFVGPACGRSLSLRTSLSLSLRTSLFHSGAFSSAGIVPALGTAPVVTAAWRIAHCPGLFVDFLRSFKALGASEYRVATSRRMRAIRGMNWRTLLPTDSAEAIIIHLAWPTWLRPSEVSIGNGHRLFAVLGSLRLRSHWSFRLPASYGTVPKNAIPIRGQAPPQGDGDESCWRGLRLKVASANVQGIHGKHKFLEEQLLDGCYDVACFQETKTKGGMFSSSSFYRFASEHETHWGVAVWIRKSLVVDGNLTMLRNSDCRVLVCDPRIIVVQVRLEGFRINCISAHLPQQAHGAQSRQAIFNNNESVIGAVSTPTLIVLGIDANARLPCGFGDTTGHIEHGEPDSFGYQLAEFLSDIGLWVPATFADYHTGETATWPRAHLSY